jgi:hypothetical protein
MPVNVLQWIEVYSGQTSGTKKTFTWCQRSGSCFSYQEEMLTDEADLTVTVVFCAVRPSLLRILGGAVDRGPSI